VCQFYPKKQRLQKKYYIQWQSKRKDESFSYLHFFQTSFFMFIFFKTFSWIIIIFNNPNLSTMWAIFLQKNRCYRKNIIFHDNLDRKTKILVASNFFQKSILGMCFCKHFHKFSYFQKVMKILRSRDFPWSKFFFYLTLIPDP
jgi:hypothetical protein